MTKQVFCIARKETIGTQQQFEINPLLQVKTWALDKTVTWALIKDPDTITHHNTIVAINEGIRNWTSRIQLKVRRVQTTDTTAVDVPITFSKTDPLFLKPDGKPDYSVMGYGWLGDMEDQGKRGIVLNGFQNWGVRNVMFALLAQQTISHEFGHVLGLEHNPLPKAVMYYAYNGVLTLDEEPNGDVDQILKLYPKSTTSKRVIDILNSLTNSFKEFN